MWAKLRVLVPFIIAHSVVHKAPLYSLLSLEPNLARITSDWEKTMQETPHRQIHSQDTRVCSRTRRGSAKSALKPRTGRWVQLQLRGRSEEDCTSHTSAGWGWDDGRRRHLGIIAAVWILPFVLLHSSAVVSLFSFSFHVFQQDQTWHLSHEELAQFQRSLSVSLDLTFQHCSWCYTFIHSRVCLKTNTDRS